MCYEERYKIFNCRSWWKNEQETSAAKFLQRDNLQATKWRHDYSSNMDTSGIRTNQHIKANMKTKQKNNRLYGELFNEYLHGCMSLLTDVSFSSAQNSSSLLKQEEINYKYTL